MKKRSFFDRLTGADIEDEVEQIEEIANAQKRSLKIASGNKKAAEVPQWFDEVAEEELSVDLYETPDDVVVRAMIPGVKKDDLDVSLTRDSITISGQRKEENVVSDDNFHVKELFWGSFSRTLTLPHEIDIDGAEASESQGVLTIKLPRIDKGKKTKLKIKSV